MIFKEKTLSQRLQDQHRITIDMMRYNIYNIVDNCEGKFLNMQDPDCNQAFIIMSNPYDDDDHTRLHVKGLCIRGRMLFIVAGSIDTEFTDSEIRNDTDNSFAFFPGDKDFLYNDAVVAINNVIHQY